MALNVGAHSHHVPAKAWLDSVDGIRSILFCRSTQQSFMRLLTTASVMAGYSLPPFTNQDAWRAYDALVLDERVYLADEPEDLDKYWRQYSSRSSTSPKLWMDAYLAAFARAGGYTLVTTDRAFRQFQGLDAEVLERPLYD